MTNVPANIRDSETVAEQPPAFLDVLDADLWHELKNQLGVVLAYTQLLRFDLDDDDSRRANLIEIHVAAESMLALLPRLRGHR
jgi:signal transduction histidine kinase